MHKKPEVRLSQTNGNAFAIMAKVRKALRRADLTEEVEKFTTEAQQGDYEHLLRVVMKYVEVS